MKLRREVHNFDYFYNWIFILIYKYRQIFDAERWSTVYTGSLDKIVSLDDAEGCNIAASSFILRYRWA